MGNRLRKLARPFRTDYSPRVLPWFALDSGDAALDRVHRIALDVPYERMKRTRRALTLLAAVSWPLRSVPVAIRAVRMYGERAARQGGGSRLRQLGSILWLANRQNIAPVSFYKFKLFRPDRRRRSLRFVQHHEIVKLLPKLYEGVHIRRSIDKGAFDEFCRGHGIATPEVFARFEAGKERAGYRQGALPSKHLFLKPTHGFGGVGVQRWQYRPEHSGWEHGGEVLDEGHLRERASALSATGGVLLQAAVRVAPELRGLSRSGACSLRIVTYHFPEESPRVLARVLRMATGDSYVDNLAAGGIAAWVGPDGRLGPAATKYAPGMEWAEHPDTGAHIAGFEIPAHLLSEAQQLCLRAHTALRDFPIVGWDVILGERGALMLESNLLPCVELTQMPSGMPLGESDFGDFYMSWFESRIERKDECRASGASSLQASSGSS